MILAVDTSLGTTVALIRDSVVLATRNEPNPLGHAEVIGDLLHDVLDAAMATPSDITTVVTGMGPGPFTGLRVGIATARAFAIGAHAQVIAVPSHMALALRCIRENQNGCFAIVTDARRREVAVTMFNGLDTDGIPTVITPTTLVPRADLETHLAGVVGIEASDLDAADLALVAERALAAGRTLATGEPLYLRAPDVAAPKTMPKPPTGDTR